MNIVRNTLYDMVPKAITLYVMRQLEGFIRNDLAGKILPDSQGEYVSKILNYHIIESRVRIEINII